MVVSNRRLEWHFMEAEDGEWAARLDENRPDSNRPPGHESAQARASFQLYEIVLGVALICAVAAYFVWQRVEQRMFVLESQIAAMRSEFSQGASAAVNSANSHTAIIETDHLRFEASPPTVELVKLVALLNDEKYRELHQNFGLTTPIDKVQIVVDPAANHAQSDQHRLVIPSPDVAAKRYGIPVVDALKRGIFATLTKNVLDRALDGRKIKPQWRAMTGALQLYLQLENAYDRNWKEQPLFLRHRHLAQHQSIDPVLRMQSEAQTYDQEWSLNNQSAGNIADPLIEYILETYGYAQIPLLLDALEKHDTWETLAPAVFNLSAEQFEKNWRAYLKEHYPIKEYYSASEDRQAP